MRSAGDPHQLIDPLKDIVRSLDANLPMSDTRTYEDVYRYNAVEGPGAGIEIVAVMGAVGLVLAILSVLVVWTLTCSILRPNIRDATWAIFVLTPWPISTAPVETATLPSV